MRLEDLGLIGNCQIAALVARSGQIVWCCLPRFDSEPVFGRLLDEDGGQFAVGPASGVPGEQRYLPNTNVLETRFETADGRFRILDFAPRFMQNNRMFRPTQLLRIIEPLEGTPLIGVHCEPRLGWSRRVPVAVQGSHHIRYEGYAAPLRLTTDIPLSYLGGQSFALSQRRHLILSWGAEVDESIPLLAERFLAETSRYWQRWVKHSNIPAHYQQEVIRSALALKLHCYEDTGAIAAALTTSIPESPDRSGRNWDYRYCWLRDSYYVLGALRLLGHFEEREQFIHYLLNVAANEPELDLRPLYRIDGGRDLDEQTLPHWAGFNGLGPVRIGNAAAQHRQHDVFGEMILALAPIYLDDRFIDDRSVATLDLLERLARKAAAVAGTPDAGIWEYRKAWEPQTFSSLMCWAGIDRVARIAQRHRPLHAGEFREMADRLRAQILPQAWSAQRNSFVGAYGGQELDAALLQLVPLRFLPPDDPRLVSTVQAIADGLTHGGWLYRYRDDDGLGVPTVAFVICTFWLIEALAMTGSSAQAKALMARVHEALSPLGLLSEDYDTQRQRMWGNFPQAYSHVGLIHAAFAAAPRWSELL